MSGFAGEWDKAHKLASQYLGSNEVSAMYTSHAKSLEEQGKLREAEKLYLYISEPDMAISMYKKHHQYDQVRRVKMICKLLYCHHWDQVIIFLQRQM
jgi:intraflagellar transport protein 172